MCPGTQARLPQVFRVSRELEFWMLQMIGAISSENLNGVQLPPRHDDMAALFRAERDAMQQELAVLPQVFADTWLTSQVADARILEHIIQGIVEAIGRFIQEIPCPVLEEIQAAFASIRLCVETQLQHVVAPDRSNTPSGGFGSDLWNSQA